MSKNKISVEETREMPTDDALENIETKKVADDGDDNQGFYKSQAEVDRAISKRLKAEREKIMREIYAEFENADMEYADIDYDDYMPQDDELLALSQEFVDFEQKMQKKDKNFDLLELIENNEQAQRLIASGVGIKQVYEFINMEKLLDDAKQEGEKSAIERIRSRRLLPDTSPAQSASEIKTGDFTKSQMKDINDRLSKGEKVYLK